MTCLKVDNDDRVPTTMAEARPDPKYPELLINAHLTLPGPTHAVTLLMRHTKRVVPADAGVDSKHPP